MIPPVPDPSLDPKSLSNPPAENQPRMLSSQTNRRAGRPWLGSAMLLTGGVLMIVVLMLGWAVIRWWNGDAHIMGEALFLCVSIMFGLAVVLSLLWLGNRVEQRFQPQHAAHTDARGKQSVSLSGLLKWSVALALIGIVTSFNRKADKGPRFHQMTKQERQLIWMSPEALRERLQHQVASLSYWKSTVANLHIVRFQPLAEAETTQGGFERLSRELRQKVEQAKNAPTNNVDTELVAMVSRHLELDDRMLKFLIQIPRLMKAHQVGWGSDSAGQRAVQWQELQAKLIAQPELWEKLPLEAQQMINEVVELEHQQQEKLREIELMQAVLQERYKGVAFSLPANNQQ